MEYGCGTGLVGLAVAPALKRLTTIDTSQGMLDVLQEKIDNQDNGTIQTLCCDLAKDQYSQKHDIIFCAMTLHHIQDAKEMLKRFADLLNPGGYIAIADLLTEDGSFHGADIEGIWHKGFDPEELSTYLQDIGLEDMKSEFIHTISKEEINKQYPIFLLSGHKPT